MMLLHNTLACEPFRKRERHSSAPVELGRSCNDLSRVSQRTALLSQCLMKEHFCVSGLLTRPHLPGQCLGLHSRQQWHISIHLGIGAALTTPRNVQFHLQQTYTTLCVTAGLNPGIPTLDPPNVNALLFSAIPKTRSPTVTNHLPSKLQQRHWSFCADQVSATCPGLHWECPFGKPQPDISTLQSSANKILPYNLEKSSELSVKFQLHNGNISEIQCPGKGKVMEVVFVLHQ